MSCNCNVKGFITNINGKNAQVQGEDGRLYENVLLINLYGTNSIPKISDNMEVLILKSLGSNEVVYALPFNVMTQDILPANEGGDYTVGSPIGGNYTQYKQDGNTIEQSNNKTVNGNVDINGQFSTNNLTNLGDAVAFVLNQNAVILDGNGFPCTIQNAGQTKTKA